MRPRTAFQATLAALVLALVAPDVSAADGPVGTPTTITDESRATSPSGVDLAYNPSTQQYLAVWAAYDTAQNSGGTEIMGRVLDATGEPVSDPVRLTHVKDENPTLASANSPNVEYNPVTGGYVLAFVAAIDFSVKGVYWRPLGTDAVPTAAATRIGNVYATAYGIAYNDRRREFLVAWWDSLDTEIEGRRISASSAAPLEDVRILSANVASTNGVSITYSPDSDQYLIAWNEGVTGIYAQRFDTLGQSLSGAVILSTTCVGRPSGNYDTRAHRHVLVWMGTCRWVQGMPVAAAGPLSTGTNWMISRSQTPSGGGGPFSVFGTGANELLVAQGSSTSISRSNRVTGWPSQNAYATLAGTADTPFASDVAVSTLGVAYNPRQNDFLTVYWTRPNQIYVLKARRIEPATTTILEYPVGGVTARVGEPILAATATLTGGAATSYSMDPAPPPGLSLDPTTGTISGTPTDEGLVARSTTVHTVTAELAGGGMTATQVTITVLPQLQHQFRPILRFDTDEKWRPLNAEAFLQENSHQLCLAGETPSESAPCPTSVTGSGTLTGASYPPEEPASEARIDIDGSGSDRSTYRPPYSLSPLTCGPSQAVYSILQDCDEGAMSAMYWHRVAKPDPYDPQFEDPIDPYFYLDYWVFYRFNEYQVDNFPDFNHEGDWEGMVVAVPKDDPTTFAFAGFDGHGHTWRYLRDVLHCGYAEGGGSLDGSCGAHDMPSDQTRINAYVAAGSHAMYPRPCGTDSSGADGDCPQTGDDDENGYAYTTVLGVQKQLKEKDHDGAHLWGNNDNPASLVEFPSGPNTWVNWPGRWGISEADGTIGRPASPQGPGGPGRPRFYEPWTFQLEQGRCNTERYTDPAETHCTDGWGALASSPAAAFTAAEQRDIDTCAPWEGPFVTVSICDPARLRAAEHAGTLHEEGHVKLVRRSKEDDVASAPGITQMIGPILKEGDTIPIRGNVGAGSRIVVRTDVQEDVVVAEFDGSAIAGRSGQIEMPDTPGAARVRLRTVGGRLIAPERITRRPKPLKRP
jgi:hypothetical protein